MMVLKDRLLFMFSSENTDNLWGKPYFQRVVFLYSIITLISFITYIICYITGGFEILRIIIIFIFYCVLSFIWIVYLLISFILIMMIIMDFVVDFVTHLIDEIKSSFKSHEEIIQMEKI